MFKTLLIKIAEMLKDFFKEIYYTELNNIDNFYRQYR